jgi:hypothetical protein
MASSKVRDSRTGYPQLHADQIDLIIESLIATIRDRDLRGRVDLAEATAADLTAFYTRRWGLPPSITGRQQRLRELVAGTPADPAMCQRDH